MLRQMQPEYLLSRRACLQLLPMGLLLPLFGQLSPALSSEQAERTKQFLSATEGDWVGRAELTPIGPRPYNIKISKIGVEKIKGTAVTGTNTEHHWTFFTHNDRLRIRFLTTFAGNDEPVYLDVAKWESDSILFRATNPELLSVRVSVTNTHLNINVYHWDKPHVEIRLTRRSEATDN